MVEINNIKTWACANNLTLNLTKTVEIVFVDSKRMRQVQPPSPLATISRVSSLKVLDVTISSQMSVSEHVSTVISSCANFIYALRTLWSHGIHNEALHLIYTSVIRAKLLYAASAWWRFTTATDRQRLEALIKQSIRSGLCHSVALMFQYWRGNGRISWWRFFSTHFCRAMLCISAAIAVMRCPSVCLSVTFVDHVKTNKRIFEIFSPSGSHNCSFSIPNGVAIFPREPP